MQQPFKPTRQGARHALDKRDIAIVRGTPLFDRNIGSLDARIRISRDGAAERALWITPAEAGRERDFYRWEYQLDAATIAKIDDALHALARVLSSTDIDRDPDDLVRSMKFWHDERCVDLIVRQPNDPRLTTEQTAAFQTAWDFVHAAVPQGSLTLDP